MKYVLGFAFDEGGKNVALIRKNRGPVGLHGRLNGVGGKVNIGKETYHEAMSREFKEEAGLEIPASSWGYKGCFSGEKYTVSVFVTHIRDLSSVRTMEDEEVLVLPVAEVHREKLCPMVSALIPICLTPSIHNFTWKEAS